MLLRRAVVYGGSARAAGGVISARGRSASFALLQLWQDGTDGRTSPSVPPRSLRRRPLSTGVDSHPTPQPPPPPPPTTELEFPPPPPTRRGSIPAPNEGSLSGDGGDNGVAMAATGVTVDTDGDTGVVGDAQDAMDLSFQRVESLESEMNDSSLAGNGGGGAGATSLDDAWDVDDEGSTDANEEGVPPLERMAGAATSLEDGDTGEIGGLGMDGVGAAQLAEAEAAKLGKEVKVARPGDERAHKMWVTRGGVGDSVSESEWEAEGPAGSPGKEDAAVIQFHSQREVDRRQFQGLGVIKEDKAEDIRTLVESFTAPALAAALRDRETALHACAHLLEKGDLPGLRRALLPFTAAQVALSRKAVRMRLDLDDPDGFTTSHMYTVRKVLQRLPRHVTKLTAQRASVMIPLCNVDGVASVLFTKRASTMRAHKNEVCFPGGKVDIGQDQHIVQTALREMGEEIGILESSVDVLGVLRCDWAEVASLIGVAVTPVVGFLGNLSREQINPNPDEVSHCFTIPIRYLLQEDRWKLEKYKAPAFVGGPYEIWGLTGYILHRLVNDVVRQQLAVK